MNPRNKDFLVRWMALRDDAGLVAVLRVERRLAWAGLLLCLVVTHGVLRGSPPWLVAVAGVALGWVVAERNALRILRAQWPAMRGYIDWTRVAEDVKRDGPG
jgi:hypothetical protein